MTPALCSRPWRSRADYSPGVMVTTLIIMVMGIIVVPLVVAALAYFLIPHHIGSHGE